MTPPRLTDEDLDVYARSLIPHLNRAAAKSMELPEAGRGVCDIDGRRGPWIARAHYLVGTEARSATVTLCHPHADTWSRLHRADQLTYLGQPVFRFTLTHRALT